MRRRPAERTAAPAVSPALGAGYRHRAARHGDRRRSHGHRGAGTGAGAGTGGAAPAARVPTPAVRPDMGRAERHRVGRSCRWQRRQRRDRRDVDRRCDWFRRCDGFRRRGRARYGRQHGDRWQHRHRRKHRRDQRTAHAAAGGQADDSWLEPGQLVRREPDGDQLGKPGADASFHQRRTHRRVQDLAAAGHLDGSHRRRPGVHHRLGLDEPGDADGAVGGRRRHVRLRQHPPRGGRQWRMGHLPVVDVGGADRGDRGRRGVEADRDRLQVIRHAT